MSDEIHKSDDQWRAELSPTEYHVTRERGTEPPFTGRYWNHKEPGRYVCVCCGAELFASDAKFESTCGWASFRAPAEAAQIDEYTDRSYGMVRTEVVCHRCGAHLGHVFPDGPAPRGLRYCINSAALDFEPNKSADE